MSISVASPSPAATITIDEQKLLDPSLSLVSPPTPSSLNKTRLLLSTKSAAHLTHKTLTIEPKSQTHGGRIISPVSEKGQQKLGFVVEEDGNLQVRKFVDRIREIPRNERWDFVAVIDNEIGLKRNNCNNFNSLFFAFLIVEELELALKLFDRISAYGVFPNSLTFAILIRCYCQKGEPDEAMRIVGLMLYMRLTTSVVTLTMLVGSFCKKGRMKAAFEVVDIMGRFGCEPDVHTHNCLLKGLCYVGRVEEASAMLVKMKKAKVNPNIYSYTVVMDGFCKVGRSDEAMELLDDANRRGLTPTAVTYSTLFNGFVKEGRPRKGLALMKRMKQRGCVPDYISYITLLHGLLKRGEVRAALEVYSKMDKQGLRVDERTMNSLLRKIMRESYMDETIFAEICQIFEKMKSSGFAIFPDTCCRFIHTFCFWERFDAALDSLTLMVRTGKIPSIVTIDRMIRALCKDGKTNEALSVFAIVRGTSSTPMNSSYSLLIDGLSQQGDVLVASSIYALALKQGKAGAEDHFESCNIRAPEAESCRSQSQQATQPLYREMFKQCLVHHSR